jgi:hypothetical protein
VIYTLITTTSKAAQESKLNKFLEDLRAFEEYCTVLYGILMKN